MSDEKNNVGYNNVGDWNVGDKNVGDCNVGYWNVGDKNVGDWNVGYWNVGYKNVGDWNVGYNNVGYNNVGDKNLGHKNVGHGNVGDWNKCNYETGSFNTIQSETVRVFNKDCNRELWEKCKKPSLIYFNITEWISSNMMSDKKKEENETHKTTGGYLKVYDYKEAFQASYKVASKEDKELLLKLPNFNADVFFEISGIDVRKKDNSAVIEKLEEQMELMRKQIEELKTN